MMLMGAKKSGAVELYEQDMIEGVLDLDQSTVEQIMRPRVDVVGISATDSLGAHLGAVALVDTWDEGSFAVHTYVYMYMQARSSSCRASASTRASPCTTARSTRSSESSSRAT